MELLTPHIFKNKIYELSDCCSYDVIHQLEKEMYILERVDTTMIDFKGNGFKEKYKNICWVPCLEGELKELIYKARKYDEMMSRLEDDIK